MLYLTNGKTYEYIYRTVDDLTQKLKIDYGIKDNHFA